MPDPQLRTHQREHQASGRQSQQDNPHSSPQRTRAPHQATLKRVADQLIECTGTAQIEPEEQRNERQHTPERVDPLRLREAEFAHGSLLSTVPDKTAALPISNSPAPTQPA